MAATPGDRLGWFYKNKMFQLLLTLPIKHNINIFKDDFVAFFPIPLLNFKLPVWFG
jgi:hypothetical protein